MLFTLLSISFRFFFSFLYLENSVYVLLLFYKTSRCLLTCFFQSCLAEEKISGKLCEMCPDCFFPAKIAGKIFVYNVCMNYSVSGRASKILGSISAALSCRSSQRGLLSRTAAGNRAYEDISS